MQLFRSLLPGLLLAAALSLSAGSVDVSWAVVPQAPSGAFLEQEPLRFTLREGFQKACRFQVSDVYGKTVSEGEWPEGGKGTLTLSGLPRGYYTIRLSAPGSDYEDCATFGVVSRPRRPTPGMPYALDSAHSWCAEANPKNVRFPGRGMDRVIELAHRSGVGFVRDRWGWGSIEPKPTIRGRYWHFVENAQKLAVHGIKTSVVYHDAPQWTKDTVSDLPTDLVANYNFAFKSAADTRGCVGAWEFWNEEDAGFTNEPAWEYAAQLKAAALGYRNGNPDATVLNGAFCVVPWRKFTYAALENDILPYIDALNVHTYNPLKKYDEWNAEVRKLLEQYGRPDMPVWITESSTNSPRDARRKSYMPGLFTYSPSQEAVIAEFVPKAQILMQAAGIEKDFFFVLSPYNEGYSDWGLLRKDYSARPGYFSFATLVHELGDAKYLGELAAPDGIRAFLFRKPDGSQSIAFWRQSELDLLENAEIEPDNFKPMPQTWTLPAATGVYSGCNLYGTPMKLAAENGQLRLTADRWPVYVHGLSGLTPATPARVRPAKPAPDPETDLSIVIRARLSGDFIQNNGRDSVDMKGASGALTLEVCNLSNETKRGTLSVAGGTVTGMPGTIELKPMQKLSFPLVFTHAIPEKEFNGKIEFTGRFNGRKTTRFHIPIRLLGREILSMKRNVLDGIYNPKRWHSNCAGGNHMTTRYDEKEGALCFEAEFPPGTNDRWVYPEMELSLPRESFKDAVGVSFEIKLEADTAPKESYFMLVMEPKIKAGDHNRHGQGEFHVRYPIPDQNWQTRVVQFEESVKADPADTRKIRIGLNPKSDRVRYWIRNLQIIYR